MLKYNKFLILAMSWVSSSLVSKFEICLVPPRFRTSEIYGTYYISNTNTECIRLQSFAPNWYRDLKSKKDIKKIVQRLEDIQIIGEIPMKY
jgi:hypothetical protein